MRFPLLLCYLFSFLPAFAQNLKGGAVQNDANSVTGTSRALVIGISSYQNIPSLQFADRDATEFSDFLSQDDFWHIAPENIILLTNENAKSGDILSSLTWLVESSKSGDRVVFYFSGHGDVETSLDDNQGYLLTYDSPRNNYATGAIGINILQKAFSNLISKGVKLLIVTDACGAGHLAGGEAGIEQTAKAFSLQWNSETKMLSSGPDAASKEGRDWGGGRGVFSFFLVKGLSGFADLNRDSLVTLFELEQYVGLQVAQATNFRQQPIFLGPEKYSNNVAKTDSGVLNRYSQWKSGSEIAVFVMNAKVSSNNKGLMVTDSIGDCTAYTELLRLLDDDHKDKLKWEKAIQFYDSLQSCASVSLRQKSRYRLSASLMNDIQQTVNQTLIGQKFVGKNEVEDALQEIGWLHQINKWTPFIYEDHFENIRRYLLIYRIAYLDEKEQLEYEASLNLPALLDSAIRLEPTAAYLLNAKGIMFLYSQNGSNDSAIWYYKKAIQFSPTWLTPKLSIGYAYEEMGNKDSALYWYSEILKMDSVFQKFDCAICFNEAIADLYFEDGNNANAELFYRKSLEIDSMNVGSISGLVNVLCSAGRKEESLPWIHRIELQNSTLTDSLETLELLIQNKILSKGNLERRMSSIRKNLPDSQMGRFNYLKGLIKENYYNLSPIHDYKNAVEWVAGVNSIEEKEYMLKLIESRIRYEDLFYLGDYIDFTEERLDSILSKKDKISLQIARALYLLSTDPEKEKQNKTLAERFFEETGKEVIVTPDKFNPDIRFDKAMTILKELMSKNRIDCNDLKDIRDSIRRMKVKLPNQAAFDLLLKPCHL